jgi:hypothetical protein
VIRIGGLGAAERELGAFLCQTDMVIGWFGFGLSAAFWQAALFLTLSRLISIKDCVVDFLSLSSLVE